MAIAHGSDDKPDHSLLRGGLLARNVLFNFIGQAAPLVVALFSIPIIVSQFGVDRLGILMIAWAVIGYFGLFDLGISRALTQLLSEKIAAEEEHLYSPIVWTAIFIMFAMGMLGAVVFFAIASPMVNNILRTPEALRGEALNAFYLLAVSVPVVVLTAGFRGIMEARQRFDLVNYVRVPLGIFVYAGPLIALPFSKSLFAVVAILLLGRIAALLAHILLVFRIMPSLARNISFRAHFVGRLLGFGAWMTVTNLIGPMMVYMDRFFVGAALSVAAVAYYATPYEMITKLWIIPQAIVAVLFPAFALGFSRNTARTLVIFERGLKYSFLVLFPVVVIIITFSRFGLNLWLGPDFAARSAIVLQWLSVGIFINSLSQVAFALIQGAGRPDLTARVHIIELPFYLLLLWFLTVNMGIEGTAIAWTLRVAVDAAIMFAIAGRIAEIKLSGVIKELVLMGAALLLLFLAFLVSGYAAKLVFLFVVLSGYLLIAWKVVLSSEEKNWLTDRLSQLYLKGA